MGTKVEDNEYAGRDRRENGREEENAFPKLYPRRRKENLLIPLPTLTLLSVISLCPLDILSNRYPRRFTVSSFTVRDRKMIVHFQPAGSTGTGERKIDEVDDTRESVVKC